MHGAAGRLWHDVGLAEEQTLPTAPRQRVDPTRFSAAFADLQGWILDEWPDLDPDALADTGGDLAAVVALVAEHTERTRAWSRQQLGELLDLATAPPPVEVVSAPPPRPRRTSEGAQARERAGATNGREADDRPLDPIEKLMSSLEGHLDELTQQVKADVAPLAVDTARQHLGLALLVSGGLGLMLGLFLGALGYPHAGLPEEIDDVDAD